MREQKGAIRDLSAETLLSLSKHSMCPRMCFYFSLLIKEKNQIMNSWMSSLSASQITSVSAQTVFVGLLQISWWSYLRTVKHQRILSFMFLKHLTTYCRILQEYPENTHSRDEGENHSRDEEAPARWWRERSSHSCAPVNDVIWAK